MSTLETGARARMLADILKEKGISIENHYGPAFAETAGREVLNSPGERAAALMQIYLNAFSSVNVEFPYWYTREWKKWENDVPIIRRAKSLKAAFSHLTPMIWPGEKLVGGKTYYYRGSFPMPNLSNSFFLTRGDELAQSAARRGGSAAGDEAKFGAGGGNVTQDFGSVVSIAGKFGIRAAEVPALVKLAYEWKDKSVEEIGHRYEMMVPEYDLKEKMMRSVICMFDSGYTIPQGREVINYYYPLAYGFDALKELCIQRKAQVAGRAGGDGITGMDRLYYYEAVRLMIEGLQAWFLNYAREARRLADAAAGPGQRQEYAAIAATLEHIAHHRPETFQQALQMTCLIHFAVLNEDSASGMSPGRLGQVLYPWYEQETAAGTFSAEETLELLELHRIKFTCIDAFASTGVVGGVLSSNTFNNLSLGGLNRDGQPEGNPLEVLILQAGRRLQSPQPTLSVMYDELLSDEFMRQAVETVKSGTGYPAFMNNQGGMKFLLNQYGPEGMTVEDARAVAIGGCLETSPCVWKPLELNGRNYWIPGGAGQPTSVGVHFIANPKVLECVLFNGWDPRLNEQLYPPHNRSLETFEELWQTFQAYYEMTVDCLATTNNIQHDIWRKNNMSVINSFLKPDGLERGRHIGHLGYRFNATYNIESCGTITMVNSLVALKKLVYEERKYTLAEMRQAIRDNFGFKTAKEVGSFSMLAQVKAEDGARYDQIHHDCLMAPKYGNDDPYADQVLARYEDWFCDMCHNFESLYGKKMYACQISVSTHGVQGAVTLASADGRLAGTTYADGSMSAYPGTDRRGPYALFNSATCWDHSRSQNSQMNLKIHPTAIAGSQGSSKLVELTRAYMGRGAFHIQYNVVDSKVLKAAQAHPHNYRDLLVRVAGFTQYWVELGKPIQDEVIARTEYEQV
jgi:4-hydroxyphenylacetate decarboxylase large subunit